MTGNPRISLEQWRSLLAVVDAGGYAQAAEALHKSQSAVTYAVQKMESLLGVKVFEVVGQLERGQLKALPLREGGERWAELYLVFADRDYAGPGALRLAEIIRALVAEQCRQLGHEERE